MKVRLLAYPRLTLSSIARSSGNLATLVSDADPGRDPIPTLEPVILSPTSCEGREVWGCVPATPALVSCHESMEQNRVPTEI